MANGDKTLNTGGGAATGNVQTDGGAFFGRDQINFIVPLGNWEEVRRLLFKDGARSSAAKVTPEQFQSFDWAKAEQAYLEKMMKLYNRVRILGSSSDVPLGNLFTQVYILDKPTARYRHDIEELRKQDHDHIAFQRQIGERIPGLELVKTGQNLFILGKPGAGKTTFLKYITTQAALKQLPRIPIFVSLNQWADSRWSKGDKAALLPFLVEQFAICDFPDADLFIDYLLRAGGALILFDGLDEVKQEKDQRRRLTRLLQDFARKYDKSQYLITCRIAASDYAFDGFTDVEIADFTPEQIREYARNWFCEQEKKFDAFTTELAKPDNKGLAELCNTPLLLSMLCLTFDNDIRFPPSRAELYEEGLDAFLRKWDSSRAIERDEIYRTLSHKRKFDILMHIALSTFQRGEIFFRQHDLEKWLVDYLLSQPDTPPVDALDSTTLLKSMESQHSIIVERSQRIYSFSHLTFQEYLTARYLAKNLGNETIDNLFRTHLTDRRWREVFLLTASLLNNADEFISILNQATNGIIATTLALGRLLSWSYERAQQVSGSTNQRHNIQLAYMDLAQYGDPITALDFIQQNTFVDALAVALAPDHGIGGLRNRDGELSSHLDLAETQAITPLMSFDYSLYYIWCYAAFFASKSLPRREQMWQAAMHQYPSLVEGVIILARDAGLVHLAQQLIRPVPLPSAGEQDWHQYATTLYAILCDERDLGREWDMNNDEYDELNDYLYANELLVQCLNVAAVSDRHAILNGLLLPSDARQEPQKIG